jgi:3-oxoacyl-[acyl-carrier-protein] synthase-3
MTGARLASVAGHRPANLVSNAELPVPMEEEWVRTRTGIRTRAYATESLVEMATAAAGKACAAAGLEPREIDLLILATCTMPTSMPGGAPQVAAALGIRCAAFDLNSACAGFSTALAIAADSVKGGSARNVLVIGADRFSGWLDWEFPKVSVLFGDGAGAAVVTSSESDEFGIGPVVWGSDGTGAPLIRIDEETHLVAMDGPAVYRWATAAVAPVARAACEAAGVAIADRAAFVPHQANQRIVASLAKALGLGPDCVVADDVTELGNTSAGSIPLALARLRDEGRVAPGGAALLIGFGAGLTWSAQVVRIP